MAVWPPSGAADGPPGAAPGIVRGRRPLVDGSCPAVEGRRMGGIGGQVTARFEAGPAEVRGAKGRRSERPPAWLAVRPGSSTPRRPGNISYPGDEQAGPRGRFHGPWPFPARSRAQGWCRAAIARGKGHTFGRSGPRRSPGPRSCSRLGEQNSSEVSPRRKRLRAASNQAPIRSGGPPWDCRPLPRFCAAIPRPPRWRTGRTPARTTYSWADESPPGTRSRSGSLPRSSFGTVLGPLLRCPRRRSPRHGGDPGSVAAGETRPASNGDRVGQLLPLDGGNPFRSRSRVSNPRRLRGASRRLRVMRLAFLTWLAQEGGGLARGRWGWVHSKRIALPTGLALHCSGLPTHPRRGPSLVGMS